MRLLNTETGEFKEFFHLETIPPYAILSHTWDQIKGEQSYQEVFRIQEKYRHHPSSFLGVTLSDPLFDDPEILAQSELCPHAQYTLRSSSIFWGLLPLWWALVLPFIRAWIFRLRVLCLINGSIFDPDSGLSKKIRKACEIARRDGYRYIWIDSSCIDKTSSSELSEAINSMFNWYRSAQVCYAFLQDVPSDEGVRVATSQFKNSRWFKRGWTLQELIAPRVVVFLSRDWEGLGTKYALADVIEDITSIDLGILTHDRALSDESVANRMRWAANRETTRVEDEAYSLLGIFGITMPTLYGEGRYAFRRLQEEILQRIPDQSLFAWGSECMPFPTSTPFTVDANFHDPETLFAPSLRLFASSSRGSTTRATESSVKSLELPVEEYIHTPHGIRTQVCLIPLQALNSQLRFLEWNPESQKEPLYLIVLRSQHADDPQSLLSRMCYLRRADANVEFLHVLPNSHYLHEMPGGYPFALSLVDLARVKAGIQLQTKTVYLPHPKLSAAERQPELVGNDNILNLSLPTWACGALRMSGYTVTDVQGPSKDVPNAFSLSLRHHALLNIHIQYRHLVVYKYPRMSDGIMIEARAWIISPVGPGKALPSGATIRRSPPYASVAWVDTEPWVATLPARSLTLVADSGDEKVTFRLELDLVARFRYNVRIEVMPQPRSTSPDRSEPSRLLFSPPWKARDLMGLAVPRSMLPRDILHRRFNLSLLGSVRRALEMKGYSVHFDTNSSSLDGFPSHSLILSSLSNPGLTIVVKYFHRRWKNGGITTLQIIARITLEASDSEPISHEQSSETVEDGPYVVMWTLCQSESERIFDETFTNQQVILTTSTGQSLTLHLGFPYAWPRFDYYCYCDVCIESSTPEFQFPDLTPPGIPTAGVGVPYKLSQAHPRIGLTLPAHVKRALQVQGYKVHFKRSEEEGEPSGPVHHILTLTPIQAGVTIAIQYTHHLLTHYPETDAADSSTPKRTRRYPFLMANVQSGSSLPCQQRLTFRAYVQTLPSRSIQGDVPSEVVDQGEVTTPAVEWDASHSAIPWHNKGSTYGAHGWPWHLPRKDIALTLPTTGHQLVLRLGFYLVWYSEYCLKVEINPSTPLPRADFPRSDYTSSESEPRTDTSESSSPQSPGPEQLTEPLLVDHSAPILPESYPRTPLSQSPSRSDVDVPPRLPEHELDETDMEYIRQAVVQSTDPKDGQLAEHPDDCEALLTNPIDLELQSAPGWSGEPESARNSVSLGKRPYLSNEAEAQGDAREVVMGSVTQTRDCHVSDGDRGTDGHELTKTNAGE